MHTTKKLMSAPSFAKDLVIHAMKIYYIILYIFAYSKYVYAYVDMPICMYMHE